MARPINNGLSYFSVGVNFFSEQKHKIAIARYGADGLTLYLYLLCEIFKVGYYLKIDEDFKYILSADLKINVDKADEILSFLIDKGLFHKKLFESDNILTSEYTQEQFQRGMATRAKNRTIYVGDFWILKSENTEKFVKLELTPVISELIPVNSELIPRKVRESKVIKEKVRKDKEKEGKKKEGNMHSAEIEQIISGYNDILTPSFLERKIEYLTIEQYLDFDNLLEIFTVEDFIKVFKIIKESDFLSGRTSAWKAHFSWILKMENFKKIISGDYDDFKKKENLETEGNNNGGSGQYTLPITEIIDGVVFM